MRNFLFIAILFFSYASFANAQTAAPDDAARRVLLVEALERNQAEVIAGRKYIDALKQQVGIKQAEIKALNEKDALAQSAITGLQSEVTSLRSAIDEASKALEIRKSEAEELKKQLDKTRRSLHRARALTKYLAITAAALAAALALK